MVDFRGNGGNSICVSRGQRGTVFIGNLFRKTKFAILCEKTPDANFRKACSWFVFCRFAWPVWDKRRMTVMMMTMIRMMK